MALLPSPANRLSVEYLSTTALTPNPKNARKHSSKQIAKVGASLSTFGINRPILADQDGMILAGHAVWEAARQLGLEEVPCVRISHLSPEQKAAFGIADNKLGDLSDFDDDILRDVIAELASLEFNLEVTGLETAEIDVYLAGDKPSERPDPADECVGPELNQIAVSQIGDLWFLGPHRLLCGDARDAEAYERILGDARAQLMFTDPPYNVPIDGHVTGLGRVKHREFAMAVGDMSPEEFRDFLATFLRLAAAVSVDGAIQYVCMDWRHVRDLLEAGERASIALKNICVWNKTNAGMGSLYRSQHEFVVVFKHGKASHINNIELGKHGRYRTNVWDYPGINAFGRTRDADLAAHPTVKPVALVADAIRDCSKRGAIVLDPFVGSGTTILAAERTGRRAAALELDPLYVDTAVRRWQRHTGKAAVQADTGRTFDDLAQERSQAGHGPVQNGGTSK